MLEFVAVKDETIEPLVEPYCIRSINEKYDVWYYRNENLTPLSIARYTYAAIPKCFGLVDSTALEASGILRLQDANTLSLKGQGVFVAFIDTGINYTDEAFLDFAGNTRIYSMWDQTAGENIQENNCQFGTIYTKEQINQALKSEDPLQVIPEQDENGHGTFLASVACGSEDIQNDFTGAAPEAELLVVKLKQPGEELRNFYFIPENKECYAETDIMLGIAWAEQIATEQNRPLVICIGFGCNHGNHNGGSALCDYLDSIAQRRHRAVVIATGNEAAKQHHYLGLVESVLQPDRIEINVEKRMGFYAEVWDLAPERISIVVQSPTGERRPVSGPQTSGSQTYQFLYEGTKLTVDFRKGGRVSRDQLMFLRFSNASEGIWTLLIYPQNVVNGIFHIWLPMEGMTEGRVYFLNPNPDTTLTMPSDAVVSMAVGGYQATTGASYLESGRGFLSGGYTKPDFVAPAVEVSGKGLRGQYIRETGTSVAAAITAGACAQILEWAVVKQNGLGINSVDIKNFLIRGCRHTLEQSYPNPQNGFGQLDVQQSFELIRKE